MSDTSFVDGLNVSANGRPRKLPVSGFEATLLSAELDKLRFLGLNWVDCSNRLEIPERSLRRWREEYEYEDPQHCDLDDDELDELVAEVSFDHPERGVQMVLSKLAVNHVFPPRARVRESMHRVDPDAVDARRRKTVKRRVYDVRIPHQLWHTDGNHKLIRFGIVIHGTIDGFSRACVSIRASDNNRAATALNVFLRGVQRYQCPSRLRCDKGGENYKIAEFMLSVKGTGRSSFIAGKSTHNQRIERLWRDVTKEVTEYYRSLFYQIEGMFGVNFGDQVAVFVLHHLFLYRINQDLNSFRHSWNNHKIRTEHNRTPNQLLFLNDHASAAEEVDIDTLLYGVEGVIDEEEEELDQVFLDPVECPLTDEQLNEFVEIVPSLSLDYTDRNGMIEMFDMAMQAVYHVIEHY